MPNQLFFGDNLDVMKNHIPNESVDLVYLDPPFNSQANYNVLFKAPTGQRSEAQIEAFVDTWHWNEAAEDAFDQVRKSGNIRVFEILDATRRALGENDMTAYLTMMAIRLIELYRVLKPTGSLYLHCDPTASHYLKILLDSVFGAERFHNEIIWKRTSTHSDSKTWSRVTDSIFFYSKSKTFTWNAPHEEHSEEYIAKKYRFFDHDGRKYRLDNMTSPSSRPNMMYEWRGFPFPEKGWRFSKETMAKLDEECRIWYPTARDGSFDFSRRPQIKRYLDEMTGGAKSTIWTDIAPLNSQAKERLGYPTQKPLALLERILSASSNPGDLVLDPFCGCGTTVHAAEKMGRRWAGIDITHLAISLIEKRLYDAFEGISFEVHGTPKDVSGARDLAARDKYQFQWWAISLVNAAPYGGKKKGADGGIDGLIYFKSNAKTTEKVVVSVKGGSNISVSMVRDLGHVVERERAKIGIFITLLPPTQPMITEAAKAGFYQMPGWDRKFPKLQILTIEDLFAGKRPAIPLMDSTVFKSPAREASQKLPDLF